MQLESGKLLPFVFNILHAWYKRVGMWCGVIAHVQKFPLCVSHHQPAALCGEPAK
jgi:hypothetical protein